MQQRLVTLSAGAGVARLDWLRAVLLQRGMLRRVLRFGSNLGVLDPNGSGELEVVKRFPPYKVASRLLWAGWKCLPGTGRTQLPAVATCWLEDHLLSGYVPPCTLFHGLAGVSLASVRAAQLKGGIALVDNPSLHPRGWQQAAMTECEHFGIHPRNCDAVLPAGLIHRMEREYERCDKITVPSEVARRSFEQFGYANKVVAVWPGVDPFFFSPPPNPRTARPFRVCYVGRVELVKGVGYLLQAWKKLGLVEAELLLIGEVRPEMESLLKENWCPNVKLEGTLPPGEVPKRYRASSVFVFPSVNEGFGLALLEAMASGLPVVATDKTGAVDCVTEGKEGFVVASRNVDALAEAILWCYRHRDQLAIMGRAARTKVEQQFTLSHYVERQIALYQTLGT